MLLVFRVNLRSLQNMSHDKRYPIGYLEWSIANNSQNVKRILILHDYFEI